MIREGEFEGFQIEEVLSRSSTTSVYRALQLSLKRPVLIKELRPELVQDKEVLERFEREAQVCARLKHENIVDIYDRSVQNERIFLVMEYVQGCSLETLIANYPLVPLALALSVILQTLRGLAYAHSQSVMHRDIKPGNILISRDGWVKITDFGLAMLEGSPTITQPGAVVGTPAYLAPEAISGAAITPAGDIFSLGVTFYQLLTGQKVFYAEHFSDSLKKVLSYHPQPLAQWRDDVPPELDKLILRMLEKQPSKRWSSAGEVLSALENQNLLANLGDPKLIIQRYWANPSPTPADSTPTPSTRYIKTRRRAWVMRLGAGAVLVLVLLLYLSTRRQPKPVSEQNQAVTPGGLIKSDSLAQNVFPIKPDTGLTFKTRLTTEAPPQTKKTFPVQQERMAEVKLPPLKIEPKPEEAKPIIQQEQPPPDLLADAKSARLKVQCDPWADVYLDDVLIDKTPFEAVEVKPGYHRLAFQHPAFPPVFREITAQPGQDIELNVNFWGTVGRIVVLVDTWAEVYVDGRIVGVTPLQEPIIVPLGTHKIVLKNPAFPLWEKDVTFQRDDVPCTLKVELKAAHGSLQPTQQPAQAQDDSARLGSNLDSAGRDSLHP
jgi:serine/threonine-protein kinase